MIPRSYNAVNTILLVQFLVILAGTLITTAMLKGYGYPDAVDMRWNPVAVLIRNWGWLAFLLPVIWYIVTCRLWRIHGSYDLSVGFASILVAVTVIGVVFYLWTAINAASPIIRVTNVDN